MTEFSILPCSICNKTPSVNKNTEITDENRYTIGHCGIKANGNTETQCIVNWNRLQKAGEDDEK